MALNTFPELFQNAAQLAGDTKICFRDETITYGELELDSQGGDGARKAWSRAW